MLVLLVEINVFDAKSIIGTLKILNRIYAKTSAKIATKPLGFILVKADLILSNTRRHGEHSAVYHFD